MRDQADWAAHANGAVHAYECTWATPCFAGSWSPHAGEIPFVFGNLVYGGAWDGQDTDAQRAAADTAGLRYRLSAEMIAAWTAFARNQDPSTTGLTWPRYDTATRTAMVFAGAALPVGPNHNEERYALVKDLPANLQTWGLALVVDTSDFGAAGAQEDAPVAGNRK